MAMVQLQAWLMIVVTLFCAARTYRDFRVGSTVWGVLGLLATIAALVAISTPVPTHAVKIDLPR
jgi:hypothetical protein